LNVRDSFSLKYYGLEGYGDSQRDYFTWNSTGNGEKTERARERRTMSVFSIIAESSKWSDPLRNPDVIWGTAGLALALLAGALLVYMADRWRKKSAAQGVDTSQELTGFRKMFERGEITEEEYTKLRDRVAKRVKAPPPAPAAMLIPMSTQTLPGSEPVGPSSSPGPDQPTPPPDSGKPANPSSPV
jgi:hypothetical protein